MKVWTGRPLAIHLWHRTWLLFLSALVLRLAVFFVLLAHNQLTWGVNEPSAIARAIVEGRGFSSAFHDANGPTAWLAPVYPALLACIFKLFGIQTRASQIAPILLNVLFSSLTSVVLFRFGRDQFDDLTGTIAGWAWALSPPLLFIPWLLWDTCLSGLVLPLALWATLRLDAASKPRLWAQCGAVWGAGVLLNPALAAPLPMLALDALRQTRCWKGLAIMIFICILIVSPWTIRNYRAFGKIVPVRSNFWPEVYFGNADFSLHPTGNSMVYQREGEMAFAADLKGGMLKLWREQPVAFWRRSRKRVITFWTLPKRLQPYPLILALLSVGGIFQAWRKGKRWIGFASVLLLYPLVYYISYTFARYRYPIEPVMYLLALYFLSQIPSFFVSDVV